FIERFATEKAQRSDAGLSFLYAHPEWIIRSYRESLAATVPNSETFTGQEHERKSAAGLEDELYQLLESDNQAAKVNLAQLVDLNSAEQDNIDEKTVPNLYSPIGLQLHSSMPWSLPAVRAGKLRVQDEGSQIAALALLHAKPILE